MDVAAQLDEARSAARTLRRLAHGARQRAVAAMAEHIDQARAAILAANAEDVKAGLELTSALQDRLRLDEYRLSALVSQVKKLSRLPDPLSAHHAVHRTESHLRVTRRRVPLGVLGVIYEARPNVTAECAAMAVKSGNAIVLRGGKEAANTNGAIGDAIAAALHESGLPSASVQVWAELPREQVHEMLGAVGKIDLLVPRGGPKLMAMVDELARVPVVRHGEGIVQAYVDEYADSDKALRVAFDSKVDRPGVCNALETLLVHRTQLPLLTELGARLHEAGVELRADGEAAAALSEASIPYVTATETDWGTEFLDMKLAIRTVDSLEEALDHIETHGTHHTAAIITEDGMNAERFLAEVDASCVLWNASTRFNDGEQLGLGAEIGISTTKMHAYGPMDLVALTSEKFVVLGDGEVRGSRIDAQALR